MRMPAESKLTTAIDQFFAKDVAEFTRRLAAIEEKVATTKSPDRDADFDELCEVVGAAREACRQIEETLADNPDLLKGVQDQYRTQIAPWFDKSWFMHRAKTKPRGYPGDYATLAAIYSRQPKSHGIGGYLDLYFLDTTLGRAVGERLHAAREFLIDEVNRRQGSVHILNVACGPCREYSAGPMDFRGGQDVRVTCVDYDTEALEFVENHVANTGGEIPPIECVRYNALRMSSAAGNIKRFGQPDIIYSVGLCDYIPDDRLVAMLRGLRETLNDNGVLYVAFKDMHEYDKTDYQWLTDWYFLQRTKEECRQLLLDAGFDAAQMEMTRDSTRSIMNFVCRVKAPTQVRIDAAATGPQAAHRAAKPARENISAEES